uniref:Uncharacterized protein n=1 Tax=Glossina brevipalpis TaxID=37001 RepID=A0A1A9W1X1_9MUSC
MQFTENFLICIFALSSNLFICSSMVVNSGTARYTYVMLLHTKSNDFQKAKQILRVTRKSNVISRKVLECVERYVVALTEGFLLGTISIFVEQWNIVWMICALVIMNTLKNSSRLCGGFNISTHRSISQFGDEHF